MMVDSNGELVDGDELVFIIAKAWQAQNRLKNNTVVGTQMNYIQRQRLHCNDECIIRRKY
jgi:hypothetical protein